MRTCDMLSNKTDDIINCPNCGGIIHGTVCDYCGTLIPTNIKQLAGKQTIMISIDDEDNIIIANTKISSIALEDIPYDFYTDNTLYNYMYNNPEYEIRASLTDSQSTSDAFRKLRDIMRDKFQNF